MSLNCRYLDSMEKLFSNKFQNCHKSKIKALYYCFIHETYHKKMIYSKPPELFSNFMFGLKIRVVSTSERK